MSRSVIIIAAIAACALASRPAPARADFSACSSAYAASDPHKQIELYTICLKHGGLTGTDVAGAFNNRGIAHEHLGEIDLALQDFISATQYDPNWPAFRANRARAEARKGQCAQAMADIDAALKFAPHREQLHEEKDHIAANCPVAPKPPN
jgi:tetratricopeptide (TPR) repeat protein